MLENIVAIELLRSGYEVCGLHRSALQKEIDFVVIRRNEKIYIIKKASIIFRHNRDIWFCEKNALKQAKNQGFSRACTTSEPLQNRGSRVQCLAFLLRKMRSLTARQTCYGAKRSMESSCPCQNRSRKASVFLFLVCFILYFFVESRNDGIS